MTQQKSERKNNRKTTVIIALLLALIAILSFGGYTLSKFVTSGGSTGKAQVAKWGYKMEIDGSKLFGKNYKFDRVDRVGSKVTQDADGLTVKASGDYNVIAPGTTGSMTFKIGGQAEVNVLIAMGIHPEKDVTLKMQKPDGEKMKEIVYNPVKWTLKKNGDDVTGAINTTLHKVAGTFHSDPVVGTKKPGAVLEDTTYELIWTWAFEGTETFEGITADELDTILGRRAKDKSYASYGDWTIKEVCTEIDLLFVMQVTQLDRSYESGN